MNLDNLRPAWRQFRLSNSLQSTDQEEILRVLEKAEVEVLRQSHRLPVHAFLFIALTLCCQGG